ncbi:bifunctional diaminohydroxyphosphoribosylaminopyrimidine deaminase/5-amino-6-(5-phosphoribosylamino)uracil reductase RibD [Caulobacter flavus]|uniref:Riboflavin biosynthesis protein RibD n=1 Tax=Caulobacter flavus TaxID=1679497 RepID=A0A2N5CNT2_9CAUL|nr:bifunctional diaminohydroxyphosphoribosylaminopyrimidine deaminase/5-amino-6-(5-phosphoribosylamino)uracil reductase RibD [Caulobacter flavus]AYV48672.1 bifunctional diaminohydroxyphosphoribosylaminopyrimidine deaminase/5-amino-6-(5-phosphoribosylamino)uracil reductase RibD [Caulobacter flavus]PLR08612.1 bifunctional diaminohydroxyphosphoribosylaminopyrimidine deaminase/5-amino-6-(5-phosphoribosylamino)uracil reductase RibD [Caulobacter flavus]
MTAFSPPPPAIAQAFRLALDAASQLAGATAPNPPVGCAVLAADGAVLAVEAHQGAGLPHAEAAALAACRDRWDEVHTLVVTLEPCNHHGRTPPCVEAILASPARAVWIGARDPNPAVAGGGARRLATAGLDIAFVAGPLAAESARLIAPFAMRATQGRPWLTVKQAFTTDGSMIPPTGAKTFASEASLDLAHALRRRADAVITGSGTILADAPLLTVRRVADPRRAPRRLAILDRRGRVPRAYLDAARERGLEPSVHADIPALLADLAAGGALEALVEAGPTLSAAFLDAGLWDERVVITKAARPGDPDTVETVLRRPAA